MRSFLASVLAALGLVACGGAGDGMEPSRLPPEVRADYVLFAQKCSKCHSLARPLQSGIEDDVFWRHYVDRMRAMPGSGISEEDAERILRFLHYFSAEQRKRRQSSRVGQPATGEATW